jgi:hypothetical protein
MSVQRPGSAVTAGRRPPAAELGGRAAAQDDPVRGRGPAGVRAYAARGGLTEEAYLGQLGEVLTPEVAGSALVELERAEAATTAPEYVLTAAGLQKPP